MCFFELFDKLGESLSVLLTLDVIVHDNKQFIPMWTMYNKMFIKVRKTPEPFGTDKKSVKKLEKFCSKLTSKILNGQLFMTYLKDLCTVIEKENPKNPIYKNKEFQDRYIEYFKYKIT